jgi:hypothetical protein
LTLSHTPETRREDDVLGFEFWVVLDDFSTRGT